MGYSTYFNGEFTVTPTLTPEHRSYLDIFAGTRRMQRDPIKAAAMNDPARGAVGLPIGPQGAYFVGNADDFGQTRDASITDYNKPPDGQPGLWCQWVPSEDGATISHDGGEKFSDYIEWIEYLIAHFLEPWGYTVNGEVSWEGEEGGDLGIIRAKDNKVTIGNTSITYTFTD